MATWGPARFNVSREAFELTFSVMLVTISFTPMVLAPLSELVGKSRLSGDRNEIFQVIGIMCANLMILSGRANESGSTALLSIPQALSRNMAGLLIVRWFVSAPNLGECTG